MIRRSDRIACFGRTGTGKSELARALWAGFHPPRIAIDVKDDLGDRLPGVPTVSSPRAVLEHPTVRAVPTDPADVDWYQALYDAAFLAGDRLIWLDEANEVTRPSFVPAKVKRFVLQGRARGCGHIACTPRPADIHPVFASQAEHVFVFHLRHRLDRSAVARVLGLEDQEVVDELDNLPEFHFLHFDQRSNDLARMEPVGDPVELTRKIAARYFGEGPAVARVDEQTVERA